MDEYNYYLIPINTDIDLESVRNIRNSCSNFMTRNTQYISESQQKLWFNTLDTNKTKPFTFQILEEGVLSYIIGYGLLTIENQKVLLSGGLLEEYRNKGLGKILFSMLLDEAKKESLPICLEVLNTNTRAQKLYESLGFITYDSLDNIVYMSYV